MPQSMGSPTQIPLVGVGSGPIGPPYVVPSQVNSLGGQVPGSQLLMDPGLFQQPLGQTPPPPH